MFIHLLLFVCLIKQHAASIFSDTQGPSEDSLDSINQLDSLSQTEADSEYKRSSAFFPLRGKKLPLLSEEVAEDKRSHFYPLRGKKVPDDLKRGSSYFMPMRGRKDDDQGWQEDLEKRMSSFMPMRGRKDDEGWQEDLEKRMSSFMPMRGKKSISDGIGRLGTYDHGILYPSSSGSEPSSSDDHPLQKRSVEVLNLPPFMDRFSNETANEKRASSFMPMRGRKSSFAVYHSEDESRLPSGIRNHRVSSFMPMRGRKSSPDLDREDGTGRSSFSEVSDLGTREQRASSFMPMRGRKSSSDLEREDETGRPSFSEVSDLGTREQRASSFMPMRGRKSSSDLDHEDETGRSSFSEASDLGTRDHRASSFMPMRGRKSSDSDLLEDKRGHPSFNAMRGRRREMDRRASSFMAMRGRRDDEGWMNFVPMPGRGKEDDNPRSTGADGLLEVRGRRRGGFSPVSVSSGIGSSLMWRHLFPASAVRSAWAAPSRKVDWDSVKRGFHATRGKRPDPGCTRCKRHLLRTSSSKYLALKRPMSFFATRGKRMDSSGVDHPVAA